MVLVSMKLLVGVASFDASSGKRSSAPVPDTFLRPPSRYGWDEVACTPRSLRRRGRASWRKKLVRRSASETLSSTSRAQLPAFSSRDRGVSHEGQVVAED